MQSRSRRDAETAQLLRRLEKARGKTRVALTQRIVEVNMPVARMLARHYAGRGLPVADLEQVAYLGLVAAAKRYDPSRGADFLAYAVPTIKGELRKHFRDAGWVVRPPRRLQELQARLWAAEAELTQSLQRSPTTSEIAAHLEVEVDDVIEALGIDGCFAPSSLDVPLGDGDATTFADRQGSLDHAFESCEARTVLAPAVRRLGARDRKILELRFFKGWSQQQIGDEIGVTQMQVSRLLTRILGDLREALNGPPQAA
ncbi:sigma-70 family RNA polymerase sigma factor [Nocardioides terrisoli]|uniref:sigma-70 family RNA polymerase sigma factor n=1 Tax=Nocardioides terrisoli TaxID=3388267 RepID=UPI00287B7188|nr:sigma-70 family RNA polymerase sigma factor [Nocardioides marmorisolisilvae]